MPALPIPPFLRGADKGSFAEDTVVRRLPAIALRVVSENNLDESTNQRLRALAAELPYGRIRLLADAHAPDWTVWQEVLQPFVGKTWLEVPWFLAETYFYRRILEATGYFEPGSGWGLDPFALQKQMGLVQARSALAQALPQGVPVGDGRLRRLIHLALWGNQADLSVWPAEGEGGGRAQGGGGEAHLLVDQSVEALGLIEGLDGGRVELILDNSGTEFSFDLLLADALLEINPRLNVRLQVKMHPFYVSDVTEADVVTALEFLRQDAPIWARVVGKRLEQAMQVGRLQTTTHTYWTSPRTAWEMPPDLQADLAGSALLISKGDANYRRWIGDAHWSHTTPLEVIIKPPAPLLLLRVLKAEVVAGLSPGQADTMFMLDPKWQVNGRWGLIQLCGLFKGR
jgi:hypothetical protein